QERRNRRRLRRHGQPDGIWTARRRDLAHQDHDSVRDYFHADLLLALGPVVPPHRWWGIGAFRREAGTIAASDPGATAASSGHAPQEVIGQGSRGFSNSRVR